MELGLQTAILGAAVTLLGAYLTNFLADAYKRFYEGSSIAAGLAGELSSYIEPVGMLRQALPRFIDMIDNNIRSQMTLRAFDMPKDPFFDSIVGKLGLLGPELVEEVAYVYGAIRGFRAGMHVMGRDHAAMSDAELRGRLEVTLMFLNRATERGEKLLPALKLRARKNFLRGWDVDD